MELRAIMTEAIAAGDDEARAVSGLGIVYGQWAELWPGYRERINKGAVKHGPMVKSYFNHEPSMVLSTLASNPPLQLRDGDNALEYTSPIPPTSYGQDLMVNLARNNVLGSSFAFEVPRGGDKRWEDENGVYYRDITELILFEVGPVTDPAYVATTAALRSTREALDAWRAAQPPLCDPADEARLARHRLRRPLTQSA